MRRVLTWLVLGAAFATACGVWRSRPPELPAASDADADLAARLAAHVQTLARDIGPRHARDAGALDAAATYVEQRLLEQNYRVERQPFAAAGRVVSNLEARADDDHGSRYFVVGAHYDTVPSTPGANDNASGVAVLLELARLHASSGVAAPIRFVAFVNEEPPWFQTELMGSVVYASSARARGHDVIGMISLETMGYYVETAGSQQYPPPFHILFPSTGHFLAAVSNGSSFGLLRRFAGEFKRASPLPLVWSPAPQRIPGVGWSDHWSFWQQGYPAVMLTDTAPFRYPHYHVSTDTPDKLDYLRLAYATRGIAAAVRTIAR